MYQILSPLDTYGTIYCFYIISLCKATGFSLLTLIIAHTNMTQGLYLIICILHTYVPTMWDDQPPNHRTVTQAT